MVGINIIPQYFVGDDLHLLRKYSTEEIISSWVGNWDPDNVETVSYRPLAIMFYNIQTAIFDENFYMHNIFSISLIFILLNSVIIFLIKLDFSKLHILIFIPLFIFSKTFTVLPAWKILSVLSFCYILFFLTSIYFLKWLKKKKTKYLIYIAIFSFMSIFAREEMYHLPVFLSLIFLYKNNLSDLKSFSYMKPIFITTFIVLLHYTLRYYFVSDAPQPEISIMSVYNFLKAGLATGLPGGIVTYENHEKLLQSLWLVGLFIASLFFIKDNLYSKNKKFLLLTFIIICLLTTPMSVRIRDFGIVLPTIFTTIFISLIISCLLGKKFNLELLFASKKLQSSVVILVLVSGIVGGVLRSQEHIKLWSDNSISSLMDDSHWIYGSRYKNATISKERRIIKINHLKKYGIENQVLDPIAFKKNIILNKNTISAKFLTTNHLRLKF